MQKWNHTVPDVNVTQLSDAYIRHQVSVNSMNTIVTSQSASQITGNPTVCSTVCSGEHQRSVKSPRHWPLWGECTGDWWIPWQRASNAENVSIWWRHHDICIDHGICFTVSPCAHSIWFAIVLIYIYTSLLKSILTCQWYEIHKCTIKQWI